jgi:hypothetical protein
MRWCWCALLLAASSLMAVSSVAQRPNGSVKPPTETPIVIEGRLKQAIGNFVQRFTQSGPTDQIAHWKDQVCPMVLGIDPGQAAFIEQRIGDLARTVRLRTGGSNCLSTLAIVITADPNGFVADMLRTYPMTLRTDGWDRLKRFVQSTRPVRWISVTDECGYGCGLGSRISRGTSPSLAAMLVVVDAKQLEGITVAELSDYLALVALSNPNDRPKTHPNSMLALFDGPRVPSSSCELTDFDRSFLATLYHEPVDRSANNQRAMIRSQMERSLHKPPPTKRN